ncbi:hypothetical protein J2T20_001123 [Paenibacillus wynnii]|nr:hypothetical protein [Paenibacillus wynnii]
MSMGGCGGFGGFGGVCGHRRPNLANYSIFHNQADSEDAIGFKIIILRAQSIK